jgi:triosephosphate isomerase
MENTNTRRILVGGNWKCNGDSKFMESYKDTLNAIEDKNEVMIFAPSIHLCNLINQHSNTKLIFGSQNISKYGNGAYTGELSPQLLKDLGINTTLIGHSERRALFGDSEEIISDKIKNCENNDFYMVICIGESLEHREKNETLKLVESQLDTIIGAVKNWSKVAIAYEPVWAIGTGKVATPDQAEKVHADIRKYLEQKVSKDVACATRIIYGGSVNGKNCGDLINQTNIDGFLVGGASLKPEFTTITSVCKN